MPPLYNRRDNDKLKTTPAEASREPSGSHGNWQLIRLQRLHGCPTLFDHLVGFAALFEDRF